MALRVTAQYIDVAAAGIVAKGVRVEAQHVEIAGNVDLGGVFRLEAQNVEVGGTSDGTDFSGVLRMATNFIQVVRSNDHRGLTSVLGTIGSGLATETLQLGAGSQGPSFFEPENTGQVGSKSSIAGAHLVPGRPISVAEFEDTGAIGTRNSILNQNHILGFDAAILTAGEKFADAESPIALIQDVTVTGLIVSVSATTDMDISGTWTTEATSSIKSKTALSNIVMGTTATNNFKNGVAETIIALTQASGSGLITRTLTNTLALSQDVASGVFEISVSNAINLTQEADKTTPIFTVPAETDIDVSGTWTQTVETNTIVLAAESTIVLTQDENVIGPFDESADSPIALIDTAVVDFSVFGRVTFSDLDISGTNPEGGIVGTNIYNLLVITPDPLSDLPIPFEGGFTNSWVQQSRIVDTFEKFAFNEMDLSQDLPQPTGKRTVEVDNTLNLLHFADNNVKQREVTSQIVVSNVADYDKIITAVSDLVLFSEAGEGFIPLSAFNTLTLDQIVRPNPRDRAGEHTIILTDLATSNIKNLEAENTITLSDDNTVLRPIRVDALSQIIGEIGGEFIPPLGPITPIIPFGMTHEAIVVNANTVRQTSSLIQVGQQAVQVFISVNAIALTAENTIGLTQFANLSTTAFASTVIDTLTDAAVANLNTTDALTNLSLFDQAVFNRERQDIVDSIIELKHAVGFSLIRDTTECDYTPFVSESDADTIPPRPLLPEPKVPALDPSVRFRLVYPPFDTGATVDSIDLRAPEFGNKERLQATRIQRDSIGGTLNVYADPIWPNIHSLQMTFAALKQTQAQGLVTFMERWIGQEIGVYDYEGRIWKGVITNPDEAITQDGRQSFSVSLEIEAERVYQLNRTALSNLGVSDVAGQDEALALSAIAVSDDADYVFTPVAAAESLLDITDSIGYNRVPAGPGSTAIPLTAFATRNSFFYESALSEINLGHVAANINFDDFGNLIHNWDARTVTETSGDPVSTWSDSVGSVDLSNIGTARPTVQDNVLSGERVLQFRHSVAVQRLLSNTLEPIFDVTNKTGTIFIVMVVRQSLTSNDNLVFGTNPGSPDSTVLYINGAGSTTRPVTHKSPEGQAALETPQSILADDTSQVMVWQRNNNNILFRRNRVTQSGQTLSTNPTPIAENLYVGGLGSGNSADMDIAQILMYDDILDLTDIQAIEGIIQAIWGI